ncbi:hypothetical protein BMS3Bbin07_00254 [bacterium BMS3Bbin07]|nr:hypothetical protein BMS3Bbin07_00254 [bacterium BMS3Bbin07]
MRVMTHAALHTHIMFFRIDAFDLCPLGLWIKELGMAPDTERSAFVDNKLCGIFRVVNSRTVAVFTLDYLVL